MPRGHFFSKVTFDSVPEGSENADPGRSMSCARNK